ncbi:hypothetical protein MMC06_002758, partial [Schaereria dolodes]|nr:hypothetical protein [Schaereria dolodes]
MGGVMVPLGEAGTGGSSMSSSCAPHRPAFDFLHPPPPPPPPPPVILPDAPPANSLLFG